MVVGDVSENERRAKYDSRSMESREGGCKTGARPSRPAVRIEV